MATIEFKTSMRPSEFIAAIIAEAERTGAREILLSRQGTDKRASVYQDPLSGILGPMQWVHARLDDLGDKEPRPWTAPTREVILKLAISAFDWNLAEMEEPEADENDE